MRVPDNVPERRPNRRLGGPHDLFWSFCAAGELRLQRCRSCGAMPWPPVTQCESCHSPDLAFTQMTGHGEVLSWAVFERDYFQGLLPIPWETILVRLDEGPTFVSNPLDFHCSEITPGMRVKVAFIDAEDSEGVFRLPVFERV